VADAESERREGEHIHTGERLSPDRTSQGNRGNLRTLADANIIGASEARQQRSRQFGWAGGHPWARPGWVIGHDGKARRVEPSIRLLAHGLSARVGRLRAYGNAIVPEVAAEFIKAAIGS
jgi:hypothetical protein